MMNPEDAQAKHGSTLLERIGNTPLLRLDQIVRGLPGITLLGKAEWTNPSGSVKDRAAAAIVRDAIARKLLVPGKTLLDATGGDTGIAYAMLGAALGFPVHLAIPASLSPERKRILALYGATADWTDPAEGTDGAIRRARELAGNDPARFCYVDQFSNDANWLAHFHTTGPEIWRQTAGEITHFVAGLGTTGTFMGAARSLKGFKASLQAISIRPDAPAHGLEGLIHSSAAIVPPIYNPHLADHAVEIETEAARAMVRRLAREEGLLVGPSAGAAVVASLQIAQQEAAAGRSAVIVAILPDAADRYLSANFWDE
ncbi:MAG: cysteine synthase family protein [Terracidiphilus sp.]